MLSVTPGSEFMTNERQFNLTVSVDVTYTLTVRASCGNSNAGQPMEIAPRSMLYIHYIVMAINQIN